MFLVCAGHGTRLKDEPTFSNYGSQGKSQTQPDGGDSKRSAEASRQARATKGSGNGIVLSQRGIGDGALEGSGSAETE
jgi:hypothetical protein